MKLSFPYKPFSLIRFIRSFTVLVLFFHQTSFSQPLSKSEFRQYFTQGNLMMLDNFHDTAVRTFLRLYQADPSNANVNYKIGVCYLNLPAEKLKAITYFENAIKQTAGNYREDDASEKNAPEDAIYLLGQAYHYAYRFDEAVVQYQKFREIIGKWNLNLVKEIDHLIEVSKNAKELTSKPVDCTIINLGDSVNSPYPDYSPVISADEAMLVFTSRREGTGGPDNKNINDEFYEDIWICTQGQFGTWKKAKQISRTINTDYNEATIGISADGQQLYVYRDDGTGTNGDIYISKLDGDYWNAPYKIDASGINSNDWEPSACISADGNTMYFVSNRQGGFGGRDIYKCKRLPNRAWSSPENLGPTINTPYDEDAPFIHPDGITFFFSSRGHNSMGGFDVFYSTKVAENIWTTPINMGYPINTTDDDIYYVCSSDGKRAYYASFRPEGKGEKDIYMVSLPNSIVKSVAILVGYLKNADGSPIPKYSSVTVKGKNGEPISCKPNEASGKFIQSMLPGQEYTITIETNGKKVFEDKFFLPEDSSYQKLGRGFFQRTITLGDTTRLFSQNAVKDTSSRMQIVPLEGKILLSQNPEDIAKNVMIHLLNSNGNIIASAMTDSRGSFRFENVPAGKNYIIKIDENDAILNSHKQFYLSSNSGKTITPSTQEGSFFLFKNISPDINLIEAITPIDTIQFASMAGKVVIDEKGKKPASEIKLNLKDKTGNIVQTITTDKSGKFIFKNLPNSENYSLEIDANDPSLKSNKDFYLANSKEELIKKVQQIGDYFVFENLPTDLNKLPAMTVTDASPLFNMKGKMLASTNMNDGIRNLEVHLINNKGKTIDTTQTGDNGSFTFQNIPAEQSYSLILNEDDPALSSLNKVYLANEADKIVKVFYLKKKGSVVFKNIPADLMQLIELKEAEVVAQKDNTVTATKNNYSTFPEDEKFDFVVYFPYNKKEIDISIGSFLSLMEKVSKTVLEKGNATITIEASSSTVPTKSFTSNEALSEIRGKDVKDKVHASMSFKNIDPQKISYKVDSKVQGPEYKNDAVQNRKEYERWQYVKVIVQ